MSLQMQTPQTGGGLSGLWQKLTGSGLRRETPAGPDTLRRNQPERVAIFPHRAGIAAGRRRKISADSLMDSYFGSLAKGDHVYRELKTEFDSLCEEAELHAISDKRFALWLQDRGAVRRRINTAKITIYAIGGAPAKKASRPKKRKLTPPAQLREAA